MSEHDADGGRVPTVMSAALEGPITIGKVSPPADPRPVDLDAVGYVGHEFFASGTATAYAANGSLRADGHWDVTPTTTAPYRTRCLVRRPRDPARFNGTVVVEWLNVTVVEAAPEWAYTNRAIVDAGAAWVGVSVQSLGVIGGKPALDTGSAQQHQLEGGGLRGANPERYGSLSHPGDAYCFDMFSQIGAALRSSHEGPFAGCGPVTRVIAAGESQSAAFLTAYVNAIQPIANVFDGFFVHSRGAGAAGVDGVLAMRDPTLVYQLRTDLDAPIMVFEAETDVGPLLRYAAARQPDSDRVRIWETAGTAHADAYLVGGSFPFCPHRINEGPQHYVVTAALAALVRWVNTGEAPPHAEPIRTGGADCVTVLRDAHGIAMGGIRTPPVDVPVATLSGEAPAGTPVLCALFGSTTPFDTTTLQSLYSSKLAYLEAFDEALDRTIENGFVRRADREAFAAEAREVEF